MIKTYKYRLYPNKEQIEAIDAMIETHRHLYNNALAERKNSWEENQVSVSVYEQSRAYTQERKGNEYYQKTNSKSCGNTLRKLDRAFNSFFRRVKSGEKPGYPRFKGRNRYNSIEYTYNNGMKLKGQRLYMQHIGDIKIRLHRPIEGRIKSGILKKQASHFYICFSVEFIPQFLEPTGQKVGIDLGIRNLAITSGGQFFPHPGHLRESEQKLRRVQRKIARRQKGSNRRRKAVLELQKLHMHISNQRRDTAHKIARELVNNYDLIAMEDLNVKGMVRNHHLAKSISDASWTILTAVLTDKAEEAGRQTVKVNPKYTSQMCSGCGDIVKKNLSVRVHECPYCNLVLDRDVNAARNILDRALGLDEALVT